MTVETWEILDHACRHCMGRLVRRDDGSGVVRCCECGASLVGEYDALCWCGVTEHGGMAYRCFAVEPEAVTVFEPYEVRVMECRSQQERKMSGE